MLIKLNTNIKSESLTKFVALCLVIPAYMNFFVSKAPLFQFIGYLSYLIPLGTLFIHQKINVSKKFIIYWAIFSILLIMPSIINLSSGRLESDLINLKGLFSKWIFLSAIMLFFDIWFKEYKEIKWNQLINNLFLFMLPMLIIIFFKIIIIVYQCPAELFSCGYRPHPFKNPPFITSEFFLLFGLLCLILKNNTLKIFLIGTCLVALILLQARTALFALFFALSAYTFLPMLISNKKFMVPLFLVGLTLFFIIFNFLVDHTFIGRDISTFGHRVKMWQLGIETIQASPWIGIGFDVTPNYYGLTYNHFENTIHNMFIRIATENGLPLLLIIMLTIFFSFIRSFQSKDYLSISVLLSVIIFHCFSTRHISINLLNIIFYITIMKSFYVSRIKS